MNLLLSKLKANVLDTILGGKQNTTCFLKENLRGQKFCFETELKLESSFSINWPSCSLTPLASGLVT